ncbi:hypothetical protein G7Y79_00040g076590 [Physcia stellaris]|nr:hypothetical protein G7Y79_00040g076590 [Physcia stellaris]
MPPKTPTDKAAAEAIHKAEQRIESHQASLREAIAELDEKPNPATGQVTAATVTPSTSTNPETATGELMDYWQARLVISDQNRRLIAADEKFQEFARTNVWAKAPSLPDPESLARQEQLHEEHVNIRQRVMDEAQQALARAGNTEEVRIREAPGFNPEATEFKPS